MAASLSLDYSHPKKTLLAPIETILVGASCRALMYWCMGTYMNRELC